MRLSRKFFIYIFLLGFFPIFLFSIIYLFYLTPKLENVIKRNINVSSEVLHDDLERELKFLYNEVISVSKSNNINIYDLRLQVEKNPILKDITIIDSNGAIIESVNFTQNDLGDSIWFKKALEGNITVSEVHAVLNPFDVILTISVPLTNDEEVTKVLIATVDMDKLTEIVKETTLKVQGRFDVVNQNGIIVLSSNDESVLERYPVTTIYDNILGNLIGNGFYYEGGTKNYYNLFSKDDVSTPVDWLIVYTRKSDLLFQDLILVRQVFQFRGILSLILSIILVIILNKKITKRISKLNNATKRLGEGDYTFDIKNIGNDEISDLFEEFFKTREALKQSEENLLQSNYRFNLAVKGSKDIIWDWDFSKGKIYVGERWWSLIGDDDAGSYIDLHQWQEIIHNDDLFYFSNEINRCVEGSKSHLEIEYRIIRKDGRIKWIQTRGASVIGFDGDVSRIAGSHTDITPRKVLEQKMTFNAFYDPLTELPNRTMLIDRIKLSLTRANRNKDYCFSILFLDYDGFKHVNDTYGHSMGDLVLIEISKRLTEILRPLDLVSRIGGDEFVIIVDGVKDEEVLLPIINRILEYSKNEFRIKGKSLYISVSIGIASNSDGMSTPEDIIQQSDIAMYHSKMKGKSCHTFFTQKLKKEVSLRWSLEHELHKALGTKELQVYYQPIINTKDKNIHSFEALLRWKHPTKGMISPGEFIPAAEETGFITNMTKWLINSICIQACRWNSIGNDRVKISFNVTAKDFFIDGGLDRYLEKMMVATGCDPAWIALEVTESVMISDFNNVTKQLQNIRGFGVKIKLDDFGTGYSSLSYLNKFEIDYIKIDKSFIESIHKDEVSRKIVKLIIHLAREMNYKTVAEGVEIEEELKLVADWGCDYIQGYYYSKPLPVEDATKFLDNYFLS